MKAILFLLFGLFFLTISVKAGGITLSQSNDPSLSWQQNADGVAVSSTLSSDSQKNILTIYIKNNTNHDIYYNPNGLDFGIQVFYKDIQGETIPLHKYQNKNMPLLKAIEAVTIKPGQVISKTIELTSDEVSIINKGNIRFCFAISTQDSDSGNLVNFDLIISKSN